MKLAEAATTGTARDSEPAEAPGLDASPRPVGERAVTLPDIGWEGFETVARLKGERRVPRLIYSQGSLTLVSPGYRHEREDRLGRLVMAVCEILDIDCTPTGSTTFGRKELDHAVEGDRTFYLANEPSIRGKDEIDLDVDPPPDLAIEVEITHPAREAVESWRKLGTPEVWILRVRARKTSLTILHRDEHGRYVEASTSRAFPFLRAEEICNKVCDVRQEPENQWSRRVRQWVRDELAPRMAQGEPPR